MALPLSLAVLAVCLVAPPGARAALTWSGPVGADSGGSGPGIVAVACVSTASCAAIDESGGEVTFDPADPRESAPVSLDSGLVSGLVCPVATQCVAVDGSGNEVTFDPAHPAAGSPVAIDPGQSFSGLACVPGGATCLGVDATGNAVAFAPGSPAGAHTYAIDSGRRLIAVSCPGATTCVAIDSAGQEIVVNPLTGSIGSLQTLPDGGITLDAIVCLSISECLVTDDAGRQLMIDPQTSTTQAPTLLDPAGEGIIAVTCTSATVCVGLDRAGDALTFSPGQAAPATATLLDATGDLAALACPAGCVAGDGHGHIEAFTPGATMVGTTLIDAPSAYSVVACPAVTQCTAIDNFGDEDTFDPAASAPAASTPVDPTADIVYGLACPTVSQCTAVDDLGQAATFDPLAPATPTVTAIVSGHPLLAVACPTVTQCTAVDDDRYAATFDPQHPTGAIYTDLHTPVAVSLVSIACPSAAQCTVLDGAGGAVTFDPDAPGTPAPHAVLAQAGIALACPALHECVAIDATGSRATFDPSAPDPVTAPIDSAQLLALSCPALTACVALDVTGHAVEFDPHGAGASASPPLGDPARVADLSCPAVVRCVAVDYDAAAFTGAQPAGTAPAVRTGPRIGGSPVSGRLLTVAAGTWRGAPTSFSPQWERCSARGRACVAIAGASGPTFRPAPAEVGHTLRVVETAANPFGISPPVTSPASASVAGVQAGPAITRAALSGLTDGRPRLSLDLRAAPAGPRLRRVTIRLPAGLALGARLHARDWAVSVGGRRVPARLIRRRGGFVLQLRRAARSLGLWLRAPDLVVARRLAVRARRRRLSRMTLMVAVGSRRGLATTAPVEVTR